MTNVIVVKRSGQTGSRHGGSGDPKPGTLKVQNLKTNKLQASKPPKHQNSELPKPQTLNPKALNLEDTKTPKPPKLAEAARLSLLRSKDIRPKYVESTFLKAPQGFRFKRLWSQRALVGLEG